MNGRAAGRYIALQPERDVALQRARECARLTIPALLPSTGNGQNAVGPNQNLYQQFQSLGARGVNNLASKLALAMFPPGTAFYRHILDDATLAELAGDDSLRGEIERALSRYEGIILARIDTSGDRSLFPEMLRHILAAGNVCLFRDPTLKRLRLFRLSSFVCRRDPAGNLIELVAVEMISVGALPADVREAVMGLEGKQNLTANDLVTLYHYVTLQEDGRYAYQQEVEQVIVEGSQATYVPDELPWLVVPLTLIPGEHYGRGYVEEYYGDLLSLEELMKAIVEGAAISSKVVFLVDPSSAVKSDALGRVKNGGFVRGRASDVTALQVAKQADLQVAQATVADITQRLSLAFLLNTSVQRSAERVTAEEIRYVAQELEDGLGGIYSTLAQTLQLPYARLVEAELRREGKLPRLPADNVRLTLTTGLSALGRGQDLTKLRTFLGSALEAIGPQELSRRIVVEDLLNRIAASVGLNPSGLVRSEQELADEEQRAAMNQTLQQAAIRAAPQAAQQLGAAIQAANANDGQQTQ